jgi:hypothetical protein
MFALPRDETSHSPLHAVLRWIWEVSRDATLDDLKSCGVREIERIARENGLSNADFRALVKLGPGAADPVAADLLERRMAALDLDPKEVCEIAPQTFRELQQVCPLCKSRGRCLEDLTRTPSSAAWKNYCPNVETLMALNALPWTSRREW